MANTFKSMDEFADSDVDSTVPMDYQNTNLLWGKAFELNPNKSYLILFKYGTIQKQDLMMLNKTIHEDLHVKNVICIVRGNVDDVKIVEASDAAE